MKFSLVIPVAPGRNAEIIESLKKLNYPKKDVEVIVVKGKSASKNRNKGAEKAKGEIIGFLDDDGTVGKEFLNNVQNFFDKYDDIDIVGGPQLSPPEERKIKKISGYGLCSKFGAAGTCNRYIRGKLNLNADENFITSANLFVKKHVMDKIKFDEKLFPGEDAKFTEDAKNKGLNVAYCPDFVIYHKRRANVKGLMKQVFNYGKVRPLKESLLRTIKYPFFLVPSLFLLYLLFLLIYMVVDLFVFSELLSFYPFMGFGFIILHFKNR